jgi:hypothetical protein
MNTKLLALFALCTLSASATAGDVRFIFRGNVTTANNPNGAYAGVAVNDPVELRCEVFTVTPPPTVVSPGQYVNYTVDTSNMVLKIGAITVPYTSGAPVVGMVNAFPVSDGVQGPNASMGSKSMSYSINHNSTLWTSTDPLLNLGTHTIVVDGSFSMNFVVQGGGSYIEMFPTNITVERVETGTVFCVGDGTGTACPCGNTSAVGDGVGCLTSFGVGGKLRAVGIASLAADTVVLQGSQMPISSALYFQGTTQVNSVFGDGLRCAGGSVIRLSTKSNVSGASQFPAAGDASVSVQGLVGAVGTRTYQVWFRNAATFCSASTFNLTNGLEISWVP